MLVHCCNVSRRCLWFTTFLLSVNNLYWCLGFLRFLDSILGLTCLIHAISRSSGGCLFLGILLDSRVSHDLFVVDVIFVLVVSYRIIDI